MAQSTLHLSVGMLLGSLIALPQVRRAWRDGLPVAQAIGRWCLLAYSLGLYATLPAIIRRMIHTPEGLSGPWWNVFLFYPLIERLELPSILLGELAAAGLFALQYIVILLAIRRAGQR